MPSLFNMPFTPRAARRRFPSLLFSRRPFFFPRGPGPADAPARRGPPARRRTSCAAALHGHIDVHHKAAAAVAEAYRALVAAGIPAEDARYLLPNACETKIVITMNVRELLHFFELRCCNRAQWEIREMAWKMLELARPTAPYIFADAGAPCIHGTCPEGKMTCGNPYPRVDRSQLDV